MKTKTMQGYIFTSVLQRTYIKLCDVTAQNHIGHAHGGMTVHGQHKLACKSGKGTMTCMIDYRYAIYMCMTDQSGRNDSSVMDAMTAAVNRIKSLVKDAANINLRIISIFENRGRFSRSSSGRFYPWRNQPILICSEIREASVAIFKHKETTVFLQMNS